MAWLARFSARLNVIVTFVCAALLVLMLCISFSGALYQAIVGEALSWTYSLARQFVPWIALLSITVALREGEHVAMKMVINAMPAFPFKVLQAITIAALGVLGLVLLVAGIQFTIESDQLVMISDQLQFSQRWVTASLPVSGAVILIHLTAGRALIEETPVYATDALVTDQETNKNSEIR
ncbi:TRAP transporter small permease [Phaeobacter sp. SYSU ZJ3003]|uniref:TRAP transporter small permease n=1 Tax=Phaeobacter sp. SYSU ZJ3003 TaxID=2109330 RepID=UPI00351C639A